MKYTILLPILPLLLLLPLVLLCSCIHEGLVIDKYYEPETFYNMTKPIEQGDGYIYVPYLEYDDPDYCIIISNENKQRRIEVSSNFYHQVSIGDYMELK